MEKVEALNAIDSQNDIDAFALCVRCFHQFSLPAEFRAGGVMTPKQDPSEADKVTYQDLDKAPAPKDLP